MYFYEICHSLRVAERVAVPLRSVRRGSRVKGWASNSELVKARAAAKFWLGVWHECDRPKSGVVNELRVYTKRRFAKELRKHRSSLKRETVSKIIENPNLVWKLRARPVESTGQNASDIDEEIWVDYFAAEFSPPDEVKNKKFSEELDQLMTKEHNYLMEYDEIGLSFNVTKCEVLLFNWNASQPEIQLGSQVVMPSKSIVYLGLPIGETLQHTRALLVKHIEKKIRMHTLESSSDEFPTSLVLIDSTTKEPIGHARVSKVPRENDACFVESVIIRKDLRGKGYGTQLMQLTEEYLASKEIKTVYLSTIDKQSFYQRIGYIFCEPVNIWGSPSTSNDAKRKGSSTVNGCENHEFKTETVKAGLTTLNDALRNFSFKDKVRTPLIQRVEGRKMFMRKYLVS
ncbi:hypothetical protein QYM36_013485 [Artemia franciscana]|uniref:N-acetyltransferase domain-containing protein n=2 Tax=Artemia franciscana TaxID=6661 RepID=A0AA88KYU2_ARTSF|nr:hypothetical protein QYM36_013485 [Artemia franciscana]